MFPSKHLQKNDGNIVAEEFFFGATILIAYIICPSCGKGLSFSNSSALYLRAYIIKHYGSRLKYYNFSHHMVSSMKFGTHGKRFAFPTSPGGGQCCVLYLKCLLPWQSRVPSHNLSSRMYAVRMMQTHN